MMDDAKHEAVQAWLFKAKRDLASARRLATKRSPLLDTAVYHCQQAAEKSLKGLLVFHDHPFPKTHDIEVLAGYAVPYANIFSTLLDSADRLTQYATAFRYPGVLLEPTRAEYEQALQDALLFFRVTLALIPKEAHPVAVRIPNS